MRHQSLVTVLGGFAGMHRVPAAVAKEAALVCGELMNDSRKMGQTLLTASRRSGDERGRPGPLPVRLLLRINTGCTWSSCITSDVVVCDWQAQDRVR